MWDMDLVRSVENAKRRKLCANISGIFFYHEDFEVFIVIGRLKQEGSLGDTPSACLASGYTRSIRDIGPEQWVLKYSCDGKQIRWDEVEYISCLRPIWTTTAGGKISKSRTTLAKVLSDFLKEALALIYGDRRALSEGTPARQQLIVSTPCESRHNEPD